jgi:hypothetical protein
MRCNDGTRNVIVDTVTMRNGEFTLTINPMDLLSVREKFDENYYPIREFKENEDYGPCGMGVGFALLPPIGISAGSFFRRWDKKRKRLKSRRA